jgi:serine O-acetyltransferase
MFVRFVFLQPGFQLAFSIRVQEQLNKIPIIGKVMRRFLWYVTTIWMGCDIDTEAKIGAGIHFPHPHGIVVGGKSVIGRNVLILQNVTLGIKDRGNMDNPVIEDEVDINVGAAVLGAVRVGRGAIIGANAVVIKDVPEGQIALGVPARNYPQKIRQV